MADHFATWIRIGGALKRSLLPTLIRLINQEELQRDWGVTLSSLASEEDLLNCRCKHGALFFCHEEQREGRFVDLEQFLVENGLPFDRDRDPRFEYSGEMARFRKGMQAPVLGACDGSGHLVVLMEDVKGIRNLLNRDSRQANVKRVLRQLAEMCAAADLGPVPTFEVVD